MVNLHLANEEEEAFREDPKNSTDDLQFCLMGSCLTDSVVHFPSLRNTLDDHWHPIEGIAIMDLGEKRYMFKFFYVVDMNRRNVVVFYQSSPFTTKVRYWGG
ncbi:hypothetical protein J1N35_004660 [Gossypium stocksii]|uniref:DUF4283 domain-containing protein n=1 Tax=Gossypium stocksii TaxID=47602 RepID=A0A9D3WEK0_9ROSI|nr:hypothetical protein J1N35_004660 [Gossypium stocksii]